MRRVFGPILSRRLGRSLGIDVTPRKICTLDCVYCQVRATEEKILARRPLVPADEVIEEVRAFFAAGGVADAVTFAGSGEPTLHSELGRMIRGIKAFAPCRVAVITNGTLLHDPSVRADLAEADLVMPNVDAGDETTFARLNRPAEGLTLERALEGLSAFAGEYRGLLPIEVFLAPGYNTGRPQLEAIAAAIRALPRHDGIEINCARRPAHLPGIAMPSAEELALAVEILSTAGAVCELPAAPKAAAPPGGGHPPDAERLAESLARHPATAAQLAEANATEVATLEALLAPLLAAGRIRRDAQGYYCVNS